MYKGGGENDKTLFHDMVEVNRRKKIIKCIDANGELLKKLEKYIYILPNIQIMIETLTTHYCHVVEFCKLKLL